jgi:homoserine dehydrogenase
MEPRIPRPGGPRVALLGLGTVGTAVATRLLDREWQEHVAARGIAVPRLVAIGVRDPGRPRGVTLPAELRRTDQVLALAADPDVDVVVELIGGTGIAADAVRAALRAARPVVTANKALLARQGRELEALARETGAALRFEAAVGGGIPVLAPLVEDLAGARIDGLRGILNGTTNHILTAMAQDGRDYEDVLDESRRLGYAELDPTTDVGGLDTADKLAILARLAFGGWPDVTAIRRAAPAWSGDAPAGITGVAVTDLRGAARVGLSIKLLAIAQRHDLGAALGVLPAAVRATSLMGATGGVTNVVEIAADPTGVVAFRGPGAGGPATSSAVLGDVLAVARGAGATWGALPTAGSLAVVDPLCAPSPWLVVSPDLVGAPLPHRLGEVALAADEEALVTRPLAIDDLRARMASADLRATAYPVLAEV